MRRLILGAVLLSLAPLVQAQCPAMFARGYGDPPDELIFGGGGSDGLAAVAQSLVSLSAGTDASKATAKYATSVSGAGELKNNSESTIGCVNAWSISFSSPIDKSDNITDLATLDGLANAFTVTLAFSQYRDRMTVRPGMQPNQPDALDAATWFWGGTATVGREGFKYVDFDAFEKANENKQSWSVSAFVGGEFSAWIVTGRLKLERAYKGQDAITRCRPIVGSSDLNCLTGPPGSPNRQDGRQISAEFRRVVMGRFGIAPTIHHDFEKDVTGINVPLFLWQDSKGQLTGGLRAGWRDDTDDVDFGVFISQPF